MELNPGGYISGVDGVVDVLSDCDIVTPAIFWAWPGDTLQFEPPAGRPADWCKRQLQQRGVQCGPLLPLAGDTFLVKVAAADARRAEMLLRRMR